MLDAEDALKQNPNDLNSRRLLARIYTHLIGDSQTNQIDPDMVKKAIEQYQKITEADPKDVDSWIMLGRLAEGAHELHRSDGRIQEGAGAGRRAMKTP